MQWLFIADNNEINAANYVLKHTDNSAVKEFAEFMSKERPYHRREKTTELRSKSK